MKQKIAPMGELAAVFTVPVVAIVLVLPLAGKDPVARQGIIWVANVLMLGLVWLGLRLRGQRWAHLGLSLHGGGGRAVARALWRSVVVFVGAVAAFVVGAVVMANVVVGTPTQADTSGYDYLRGNLPMLLLALAAVYIVSSLGEEIVYRGFLITRLAELGSGGRAAWRAAVLVSAVVFGAAHYDWGVVGVVQTGFMGLALGVAYLVLRRDLWPLVLAHAYMDTILLVQMYASGRP